MKRRLFSFGWLLTIWMLLATTGLAKAYTVDTVVGAFPGSGGPGGQLRAGPEQRAELQQVCLLLEQPAEVHRPRWGVGASADRGAHRRGCQPRYQLDAYRHFRRGACLLRNRRCGWGNRCGYWRSDSWYVWNGNHIREQHGKWSNQWCCGWLLKWFCFRSRKRMAAGSKLGAGTCFWIKGWRKECLDWRCPKRCYWWNTIWANHSSN